MPPSECKLNAFCNKLKQTLTVFDVCFVKHVCFYKFFLRFRPDQYLDCPLFSRFKAQVYISPNRN
jgi:hypothetical protein